MKIFSLLVALSIAIPTFAVPGLLCGGNKVVNPNRAGFSFPNRFTTDQPASSIQPGQDCLWTVMVPPGKYAKVEAVGKIGSGNQNIQAMYGGGYIDASSEENLIPYFFPAPRFNLRFYAAPDSVDAFSFRITWANLPDSGSAYYVDKDNVMVRNASSFGESTILWADNSVSVVVIPADPNNIKTLRSTLVYDGSADAPFMGTLLTVAQTGKQMFSLGQVLTVVDLNPTNRPQDLVLVQDYSNTVDYRNYVGIACDGNGFCNSDAFAGDTMKTVYISASKAKDTLTKVTMADDATFTVYNGTINPKNLIASYNSKTLQSALPLSFDGYIKQYVIDKSASKLEIIRK